MSPEDNRTMNILVCRESRYRGAYGRFLSTCRNSDETRCLEPGEQGGQWKVTRLGR